MSYNNIYGYDYSNMGSSGDIADIGTITITSNTAPYISPNISNTATGAGAFGSSGYSYTYGPTLLTTGTDTLTISDISNINPWGNTLDVKGDANFEGDVKLKGKSLIESLEKIEEKLAILRPNEELEGKWDELRELRKKYMELEKEIIEKQKVWDILKK